MKDKAVILVGGLILLKNPYFLKYIKECEQKVFIVDEYSLKLEKCFNEYKEYKDHPFSQVEELFYSSTLISFFNKIQDWSKNYEISNIICLRENFVHTVGILTEIFNLPNVGLIASKVCSDKSLQRKLLKQWSPLFLTIKPNERKDCIEKISESSIQYPLVLKPVGRSSSSGVKLIHNDVSLKNEISLYSEHETLLIEEYVIGKEFSVESLIVDGEIVFQGITEKITNENNSNYFVEMGHLVPANNILDLEKENLLKINKKIISKLSFKTGISHAEYKITRTGEIKLMEIAARPPGDAIIDLYSISMESFFEKTILDVFMNNKIKRPKFKKFAKQVFLEHPKGSLRNIKSDSNLNITWVYEPNINQFRNNFNNMIYRKDINLIASYRQKGEFLTEISSSYERSCAAIINSKFIDELNVIERYIKTDVIVITENNNDY